MASKRNFYSKLKYGSWNDFDFDELDKELGVVRCTGALGRKRIEPSPCSSPFKPPLKRQCSMKLISEKSILEALPQDVLVQILCGVEHDDLAQLLSVSKSIKEATLIAKDWHFAFRTPSSKAANLWSLSDLQDEKFDSHPIPDAPKHGKGHRSRMSGRNLTEITVALFRSTDEDSLTG